MTTLVIQPEQLLALEQASRSGFGALMVDRLRTLAPAQLDSMGARSAHSLVEIGIDRGRSYGLVGGAAVAYFIELMMMFGVCFDTDPQLPWARTTLTDKSRANEMDRADMLYVAARNYIQIVVGPESSHVRQALKRAVLLRFEELPASQRSFSENFAALLRALYPQKYEYVGEGALRLLLARGVERAKEFNCADYRGISLIVALMFALGHGVTEDPRLPWVEAVLSDKEHTANERLEHLHRRAIQYFELQLSTLD